MDWKIIKTSAVMLVLLILLLSMVPAATMHAAGSKDSKQDKDARYDDYKGKKGMGHKLDQIDMVISLLGVKDKSIMFEITNAAAHVKRDKVASFNFSKPLKGAYNVSNDMAYIKARDMKNATIMVSDVNNSSIGVANASAILSMKDIDVLFKDNDYFLFEFGTLSLYLPNGTVQSHILDQPVKVLYSERREMVVMDANPAVTDILKTGLETGQRFDPAAPPIPVKDLVRSEGTAGKSSMNCVR